MRAIFFATLSWAQASALLVVACGPLVHCPAAGGVQTRLHRLRPLGVGALANNAVHGYSLRLGTGPCAQGPGPL